MIQQQQIVTTESDHTNKEPQTWKYWIPNQIIITNQCWLNTIRCVTVVLDIRHGYQTHLQSEVSDIRHDDLNEYN